MDLQIFVRSRTGIVKELGVHGDHALFGPIALVLQHSSGLRCHAVDTPIGLPVTIADGDGETTKIAPHHLYLAVKAGAVAVQARHRHVFPFAAVVRLIEGAVGATTFWERQQALLCLKIGDLVGTPR